MEKHSTAHNGKPTNVTNQTVHSFLFNTSCGLICFCLHFRIRAKASEGFALLYFCISAFLSVRPYSVYAVGRIPSKPVTLLRYAAQLVGHQTCLLQTRSSNFDRYRCEFCSGFELSRLSIAITERSHFKQVHVNLF
jgi:hypothetical protein